MLFDDAGRLLLVRNTYGNSERFGLPGGGVRPWEKPHKAARRELREEVSIEANLSFVSVHASTAEGKRDTVFLFKGLSDQRPMADGFEIAEAAFFPLDELPEKLSPATARRIAEHRGERDVSPHW